MIGKKDIARILMHIASIFSTGPYSVTIRISDATSSPGIVEVFISGSQKGTKKNFTLVLNLFNRAQINIPTINSGGMRLGGKAIAAVYNIAIDLGFKEITYTVVPSNAEARRFYFHTDFGAPKSNLTDWSLQLR